jgi:hypothetical protein
MAMWSLAIRQTTSTTFVAPIFVDRTAAPETREGLLHG